MVTRITDKWQNKAQGALKIMLYFVNAEYVGID